MGGSTTSAAGLQRPEILKKIEFLYYISVRRYEHSLKYEYNYFKFKYSLRRPQRAAPFPPLWAGFSTASASVEETHRAKCVDGLQSVQPECSSDSLSEFAFLFTSPNVSNVSILTTIFTWPFSNPYL